MEAASYRSRRVLAEIDPHSEWVHGDEFETLIVDVSGFTKNQLKVQVEPSGSLRISGERALNGGQQWCHFIKRFDLPATCDAGEIKVQLDKGMLYVQVPRPSATTMGDDNSEEYPEDAQPDEPAGAYWSGIHTTAWGDDAYPARRLAKSLGKHRYVVLNIVLAAVLLWLVAFAKSRPSIIKE